MGKNQQHKAQQRSRHAGDGDDLPTGDTTVDVSFHTPEWHAARVAALTAERKTWEEWKLEQKEKASALAAVEDEEDRQNREYKAQLAADRVQKLAGGTNKPDLHAAASGKVHKKEHKSKDKKHHKSDKSSKKHKDSKKQKSSKDKKQKHRKHASSNSSSDSDSDAQRQALPEKSNGPVKLSDFMRE